MSIATDEADKNYPAPTDDDDPMYKYMDAIAGYPSEKRQAYIAGRTTEPTAAEVEAATKAYVLHHIDFTRFTDDSYGNTNSQQCSCGKEFPNKNARMRHILHEALLAARKAVSE